MRWRVVGMAVLAVGLAAVRPGPAASETTSPEKAEVEKYLKEFDRKAHASADELRGELVAPFLAIRGGPLMKVMSASASILDQALDPFPPNFELQRTAVLYTDGRLAIGTLIYQTDDLPSYMTLLLARSGKGWKAAALIKAMPDIDTTPARKFIQDFDKAAHQSALGALKYFRQPCHRLQITGQGDAAAPQITELPPNEAAAAIAIPIPDNTRLKRSEVVACWKDLAILSLEYGNSGRVVRWLVLAAKTDGRWQIAALSRTA